MSIVNPVALKKLGCELWYPGGTSSTNSPKQITANGGVTQVLPFPGAGIGMFDGDGDYIKIHDGINGYDDLKLLGISDFTIEFWYNTTNALGNFIGCVDAWTGTNGWLINFNKTTNTIGVYTYNAGAYSYIPYTNASNFVAGNHYFTFIRSAGILYLYIDGISVGTPVASVSTPSFNTTHGVVIGIRPDENNSQQYTGNLSEFRISSVARYTSNFTPPRRQLESDANTKLLLHFNRNDSTFVDSSPNPKTITAYGNAKQLCSPCGSGVAYFNGNGDWLDTLDHADFNFGDGNWTIECWFNKTGGTGALLAGQYNSSGNANAALNLAIGTDLKPYFEAFYDWSSGYVTFKSSVAIVHNTWNYIEVVHSGSGASRIITMYLNGNQVGSVAFNYTLYNSTSKFAIGRVGEYANGYFNGYISEFRLSNKSRNNFVPTQPFKPDPYTKLLLHMDEVGQAFYDASDAPMDNGFMILPDGVTVTPAGTWTQVKGRDGRNYAKFDGSTNAISIQDHDAWSMFLNNFTICGWIKFDSVAANRAFVGQYTDANNQWYIRWTTSNVIQIYGITSSVARFNYSCSFTPTVGVWYHITVQRSGSSCIMMINGVSQTVTTTTAWNTTATNIASGLSIGEINTEYHNGNIKDLQLITSALTQDQIYQIMSECYIE